MIAIVRVGDPLETAFYADMSEAQALVLFSRYFGTHDVAVLDSISRARSGRLSEYAVKKIISKKKFDQLLNTFRPEIDQLSFLD